MTLSRLAVISAVAAACRRAASRPAKASKSAASSSSGPAAAAARCRSAVASSVASAAAARCARARRPAPSAASTDAAVSGCRKPHAVAAVPAQQTGVDGLLERVERRFGRGARAAVNAPGAKTGGRVSSAAAASDVGPSTATASTSPRAGV